MTEFEHFMLSICFIIAIEYMISEFITNVFGLIVELAQSRKEKKRLAKAQDKQ